MNISDLFVKSRKGEPLVPRSCVALTRSGGGIASSVHADVDSPRQLLVGDSDFFSSVDGPRERLRWNIHVTGLLESVQDGDVLRFDSGAKIWITMYCEPCSQLKGIPDWSRLGVRRGALAMVVDDGPVAKGDRVSVVGRISPLPDRPVDRVCAVLAELLNDTSVITIPTLLTAAGLQSVYARAVPNYLVEARRRSLPWFRVVRSNGEPFDAFYSEQSDLLRSHELAEPAPALFEYGQVVASTTGLARTWLEVRASRPI